MVDKKFIGLGSAGTKKGNANGGLRTLEIPADSSGDASGAQNFYCWFHLCFYAGLMGQTGEMCINFLTEDDKLICGCTGTRQMQSEILDIMKYGQMVRC